MLNFRAISLALLAASCVGSSVHAQISLSTAVDLALRNSPKVRMAEADLKKSHAALGEAKDAYVPNVSAVGGVGKSAGAPLGVPTVFQITAQSLVFARSQSDFIRAARAGLESAQHALNEARIEVVEDTTNTYVGLSNALTRRDVLTEERTIAKSLVDVTSARVDAGVDAQIELTKSKRTAVQIRLQSLNIDDEISQLTSHLAQLTGVQAAGLTIDAKSLPQFTKPQPVRATDSAANTEGITAAFAAAKSKEYAAEGDRRSLFWPQVAFGANYSRVNTAFSNYQDYYPRFAGNPATGTVNSENSLSIGLQITIPLLDFVHRAKARQSAADAAHALAEAQMQRDTFLDGRAKLRNSALELDARSELASLDRDLAQNQLEAVQVQLQANAANASGTPMNPKDELSARLQERAKYYDMLTTDLQLQQVQVNLLRQEGNLADWIHNSIGASNAIPSQIVMPQTNTPGVPGSAPTAPAPTPAGAPIPELPRPAPTSPH